MYEDVEADYWKEIFVHLQHKNMMRMGSSETCPDGSVEAGFAEKLTVSNAQEQFDIFLKRNPELSPAVEGLGSYFTWEVFVTSTVKVRLFIQNQIKCSLMQNIKGDFTKIADAKFPNNPFPELEEFLSRKMEYEKELGELKGRTIRSKKKQKIAGEFIKAMLMKKFRGTDTIWYLEPKGEDFLLTVDGFAGYTITIDNFVDEINCCNNI